MVVMRVHPGTRDTYNSAKARYDAQARTDYSRALPRSPDGVVVGFDICGCIRILLRGWYMQWPPWVVACRQVVPAEPLCARAH